MMNILLVRLSRLSRTLIFIIPDCDLLLVPAAYDYIYCGQMWELVHRARATDNQFFQRQKISGARNTSVNYILHGHSMVIDPSGTIVAQAGIDEEIIFSEIGTCAAIWPIYHLPPFAFCWMRLIYLICGFFAWQIWPWRTKSVKSCRYARYDAKISMQNTMCCKAFCTQGRKELELMFTLLCILIGNKSVLEM